MFGVCTLAIFLGLSSFGSLAYSPTGDSEHHVGGVEGAKVPRMDAMLRLLELKQVSENLKIVQTCMYFGVFATNTAVLTRLRYTFIHQGLSQH